MHRKLLLTTAIASLTLLAACGRGGDVEEPGQTAAVNTAQDAASAVVGPTSAATLGATLDGFVTNAAIGDMYEIQSSQLAMERSQNAQVREVAQMLITDHSEASAKLKALVDGGQVTGVTLPTEMDERRKGLIDNLRATQTAQDFDNVYLDQQAAAHRETLLMLDAYQVAGQNEALKAYTEEVEPRIVAHLDRVSSIDRSGAPSAP